MPEIDNDKPTIFSQPGCVQCTAVKRKLKEKGVEVNEIDVSESQEAFKLLTEDWGYQRVPVVYFKGEHFGGFDPDRLESLVATYQAVAA